MRYFVNEDCIGCGLCVNTCPEVFEMTDEGVARASEEDVDVTAEASAKEAMEGCPVEAIETK